MKRRGFTLVEMLVSLVLLSVVLQICYVVLTDTLDAEESIRRQIALQQTADGAAALIAADLGNIMLPTPEPTPKKGDRETQDKESQSQDDPPIVLSRNSMGLSELSFSVSREPYRDGLAGDGGPAEVSYRLEGRRDGTRRLIRKSRQAEIVAGNLSRFDLEVYRRGAWQPWRPEAGREAGWSGLPPALRLAIVFQGGKTLTRTFLLPRSLQR